MADDKKKDEKKSGSPAEVIACESKKWGLKIGKWIILLIVALIAFSWVNGRVKVYEKLHPQSATGSLSGRMYDFRDEKLPFEKKIAFQQGVPVRVVIPFDCYMDEDVTAEVLVELADGTQIVDAPGKQVNWGKGHSRANFTVCGTKSGGVMTIVVRKKGSGRHI